jgi:hypothetical protein
VISLHLVAGQHVHSISTCAQGATVYDFDFFACTPEYE